MSTRMIAIFAGLTACLLLGVGEPASASDFPIADRVLVEKGKRELHLLKNGVPFRTFKIALGMAPEGHKEREGDQKTPEGVYLLDARNPESECALRAPPRVAGSRRIESDRPSYIVVVIVMRRE